MNKSIYGALLLLTISFLNVCDAMATYQNKLEQEIRFEMKQYFSPSEEQPHEGTWLIWPHHYTYGIEYRNEIEDIWLEMVFALHTGELIHIVAYDETERKRITKLLKDEEIDMKRVDFVIAKSDDVWVRDTGPMFVFDKNNKAVIADFAFDGWGGKTPYKNDDSIPKKIATAKGSPIVSIPNFVLEGGSVELDGSGTAMLCKSSVVSTNRNPSMSVVRAEKYLAQYFGVTNFIWLTGVIDEDITDAHIDGMARFYDDKTILTVAKHDFLDLYKNILPEDYDVLLSAKNSDGAPYKIVILPMTAKNVDGLDYKGNYLNYYVGNEVVLLPIYADVNDKVAIKIISKLYFDREIVPINVTALYQYGGMIHCITQQQPQE